MLISAITGRVAELVLALAKLLRELARGPVRPHKAQGLARIKRPKVQVQNKPLRPPERVLELVKPLRPQGRVLARAKPLQLLVRIRARVKAQVPCRVLFSPLRFSVRRLRSMLREQAQVPVKRQNRLPQVELVRALVKQQPPQARVLAQAKQQRRAARARVPLRQPRRLARALEPVRQPQLPGRVALVREPIRDPRLQLSRI
jgi:hypothetical protein